jgi:hypothetical protein
MKKIVLLGQALIDYFCLENPTLFLTNLVKREERKKKKVKEIEKIILKSDGSFGFTDFIISSFIKYLVK